MRLFCVFGVVYCADPHNVASVHFWNKVIAEYTGGNYRLVEGYLNAEVDYEDGTPANVYFFEN